MDPSIDRWLALAWRLAALSPERAEAWLRLESLLDRLSRLAAALPADTAPPPAGVPDPAPAESEPESPAAGASR